MKPQTYRRHVMRSDLPEKARHVAHVLAADADFTTGAVTMTLDAMQAASGIKSKTTVKVALDLLVDTGWLMRFPSGSRRKPTRYRLTAPAAAVQSVDHEHLSQPVDNSPEVRQNLPSSGPVTGPLSSPVVSVAGSPLTGPLYGRELSSPTEAAEHACAQPAEPAEDGATVVQLTQRLGNRLANLDRDHPPTQPAPRPTSPRPRRVNARDLPDHCDHGEPRGPAACALCRHTATRPVAALGGAR